MNRGRNARHWLRLVVPALLLAPLVIPLVSSHTNTAERTALVAYQARLLPLVREGGKTVQLGMKPGIQDLQYRHVVPASLIAQEGAGWVVSLQQVRADVVALRDVQELLPVTDAFIAALDGYLDAARTFRAAALKPPHDRVQLIEAGIRSARTADRRYDHAAALLQQARHRAGLSVDANFPNPLAPRSSA